MSDCLSGTVVQGELDGCDVRCPAEAPVPARECEIDCGWPDQVRCGPGLYCSRALYADAHSCQPLPPSCSASDSDVWVCAADGETYPSLCEAHRARTDLVGRGYDAYCDAPNADLYPCGGIFCRRDLETCDVMIGPDDHDVDSFACIPIGGAGGESGAGAGGRG